uniref:Uncharacterized protein n=1 Tax=Panagrolaimus superbus TaxID=310955 RepID=A0A914Y7L2_9BILA
MPSQIPPQWMAYISLILYGLYLLGWHLFQRCKKVHRLFYQTLDIPLKQARLHRIIYRHKRDPEEISRREDFVTIDDGFVSKEVLKGPEWQIYTLDKKGAIFVETPKPLSHYTIDKYPFVYIPIFEEGLRVAEIDLESYLSLGDQLEVDYKPPRCLFFTNTARCASTLLGSMLQHDGHSTVIGEHYALTVLSIGLKDGYWSDNDISRLLPTTIKLIRKCIPSDRLFVFKGSSAEVMLVPYLTREFPEIKHIFMFRRNALSSVERVIARDPSAVLLLQLYNFSPLLATQFGFIVANEGALQRQLKPQHIKEFAMLVYGGSYMIYKQNKDSYDFPIVWHDQLIATPDKVLAPIFAEMDIPESCIPDAITRMQRDSQDTTFLSRDKLQNIPITEMTPELKASLQRYAEKLQMEPDVAGLDA